MTSPAETSVELKARGAVKMSLCTDTGAASPVPCQWAGTVGGHPAVGTRALAGLLEVHLACAAVPRADLRPVTQHRVSTVLLCTNITAKRNAEHRR